MFECLRRRHRHLRTWVLGLFAALWLVALSSAAPTRMALPLLFLFILASAGLHAFQQGHFVLSACFAAFFRQPEAPLTWPERT